MISDKDAVILDIGHEKIAAKGLSFSRKEYISKREFFRTNGK